MPVLKLVASRVSACHMCAFGCTDLQGAGSAAAVQNAAALDCSVAPVGLQQLLASTGRGELVLVSATEAGPVASAPVHPLPQAQPFILEAAYEEPAGRRSLAACLLLLCCALSIIQRLSIAVFLLASTGAPRSK